MNAVAVLMTCHDRRDTTVAALRALFRSAESHPGLRLHVFLTDDGSRDGTSDAVRALGLPITILRGDGDLFWNRGMVRAWDGATRSGEAYDAFLLLNDDTVIDADGLTRLMRIADATDASAVVVGAIRDPLTGERSYGGVRRSGRWHPGRVRPVPVSDEVQDVDSFNANCVLVPRRVFDAIGPLDPTYTHSMGDIDYGYRAQEAGFRVVVAPGTVGVCGRNDAAGTWRDVTLPVRERLRRLESPKGLPRSEWRSFLERHRAPLPSLMALLPALRIWTSGLWYRSTAPWRRRARE